MKRKFLLGLTSLALVLPLASCGYSIKDYEQIANELVHVYKDHGIEINLNGDNNTGRNQRSGRRNFAGKTNPILDQLKTFELDHEMDEYNINDRFFEAFGFNANPILVYGEIFKGRGQNDFLNKVIFDGSAYFKIDKNDIHTKTKYYIPHTVKVEFNLYYTNETDYYFESFQIMEKNQALAYVWGNSDNDFLLMGQEQDKVGGFYTEDLKTGYQVSGTKQKDLEIFNQLSSDYDRIRNDSYEDMTKDDNLFVEAGEYQEMAEKIFPSRNITPPIVIETGWFEGDKFTMYVTNTKEKSIRLPDNMKINNNFVINDYSNTVKELIIPSSVTMEVKENPKFEINQKKNDILSYSVFKKITLEGENNHFHLKDRFLYLNGREEPLCYVDDQDVTKIGIHEKNPENRWLWTGADLSTVKEIEYSWLIRQQYGDGYQDPFFWALKVYTEDVGPIRLDKLIIHQVNKNNTEHDFDFNFDIRIGKVIMDGNIDYLYINDPNLNVGGWEFKIDNPNFRITPDSDFGNYEGAYTDAYLDYYGSFTLPKWQRAKNIIVRPEVVKENGVVNAADIFSDYTPREGETLNIVLCKEAKTIKLPDLGMFQDVKGIIKSPLSLTDEFDFNDALSKGWFLVLSDVSYPINKIIKTREYILPIAAEIPANNEFIADLARKGLDTNVFTMIKEVPTKISNDLYTYICTINNKDMHFFELDSSWYCYESMKEDLIRIENKFNNLDFTVDYLETAKNQKDSVLTKIADVKPVFNKESITQDDLNAAVNGYNAVTTEYDAIMNISYGTRAKNIAIQTKILLEGNYYPCIQLFTDRLESSIAMSEYDDPYIYLEFVNQFLGQYNIFKKFIDKYGKELATKYFNDNFAVNYDEGYKALEDDFRNANDPNGDLHDRIWNYLNEFYLGPQI